MKRLNGSDSGSTQSCRSRHTLREQDGERQGCPATSSTSQQKQRRLVYKSDAQSGHGGSHLGSTMRLGSLVERPARPREQAAVAAE